MATKKPKPRGDTETKKEPLALVDGNGSAVDCDNKFPEEMSMVDLFDVEYQDIYDQTHWKQFSPLDLD